MLKTTKVSTLMKRCKYSPERASRQQAGVQTPAGNNGESSPERATDRSATPSGFGFPHCFYQGFAPLPMVLSGLRPYSQNLTN